MTKQRLSASVDSDLLAAAERAVAEGLAENVSAWVNAAMRRQMEHEHRMRALADFVAAYESKHGTITGDEMTAARRRARSRAIVVRGPAPKRRRSA
jgi:Arc/MetJ-type ribon-helix-helix transcriptional regulator